MAIRVVDLKAMRQRIVLNLIAIAIACGVGNAYTQTTATQGETIESTFVVWKSGSFDRTIIEKTTNYDSYNKVLVLPLRYDKLEIDTGNDTRLSRNWRDFIETDMPAIAQKFGDVATKEFQKEQDLALSEQPGPGVLLVAVELLRLEPKSFRDSSLDTIGEETMETVGFLDYQIILMDSTGGFVVGLIEDSVRVSLWRKAKNIRGNHFRAWSRTFEYITSHFKGDFKELKKQTSTVAD